MRSDLREKTGEQGRHMSFICLFIQQGTLTRTTRKFRYMGLARESGLKVDFMNLLGESLGLAETQPTEVPGSMYPCILWGCLYAGPRLGTGLQEPAKWLLSLSFHQ